MHVCISARVGCGDCLSLPVEEVSREADKNPVSESIFGLTHMQRKTDEEIAKIKKKNVQLGVKKQNTNYKINKKNLKKTGS